MQVSGIERIIWPESACATNAAQPSGAPLLASFETEISLL
jgi:hypothetical protein